jgi:hypothetical protein
MHFLIAKATWAIVYVPYHIYILPFLGHWRDFLALHFKNNDLLIVWEHLLWNQLIIIFDFLIFFTKIVDIDQKNLFFHKL